MSGLKNELIVIIFFVLLLTGKNVSATYDLWNSGYSAGYSEGQAIGKQQGIEDHNKYGSTNILTPTPEKELSLDISREYRSGYRSGFREGYKHAYFKYRF